MKIYNNDIKIDPSGFVVLAEFVPAIVQEIRYYSTYNFIGERIDGYEEPCALNTTLKNYYQGVERVGLTLTVSVMQNFALTALGAFVISRFAGVTGV